MQRSIVLTTDPLDVPALVAAGSRMEDMGAVIYFSGVVRRTENGISISGIEYEAFSAMAQHQLNLIIDEISARWSVGSVRLVHRLGWVPTNETSLWVEVIAPHRGESFLACQFLIDEMKKRVPIWKKPI